MAQLGGRNTSPWISIQPASSFASSACCGAKSKREREREREREVEGVSVKRDRKKQGDRDHQAGRDRQKQREGDRQTDTHLDLVVASDVAGDGADKEEGNHAHQEQHKDERVNNRGPVAAGALSRLEVVVPARRPLDLWCWRW
jgi:hypothetical protein